MNEKGRSAPTPRPSSPAARSRMVAARQRDTKPELQLRSALHRMGLRFRVDVRPLPDLPRRADIVFRRARVAVFVDGCFWHGCPEHGTRSKANAEWWRLKIEKNRERDSNTTDFLREAGWRVVRAWEHESPSEIAEEVAIIVRQRSEL